jgi:uncharacterized protein YndB with AHSA1/START domain
MKEQMTKLVIKRLLKADRKRVFSALTDPQKMTQWFYGMETGRARVTSDFRVGGKYSIEMSNDEQNCVPRGEYLEIVPPEKLVFTWFDDHLVKQSKVTIELFEKGPHTELILTHELPQDVVDPHRHGWLNCLDHLEALLGKEQPAAAVNPTK